MTGTHPNRLFDTLIRPRAAAISGAVTLTLAVAACSGGAKGATTAPTSAATPAAAGSTTAATLNVTPDPSVGADAARLLAQAVATPVSAGAQATPATSAQGKGRGRSGQTLTADQVLTAFTRRGLSLGTTTSLTAATDPDGELGKPGEYTAKLLFVDTSLGTQSGSPTVDDGGAIEVFATAKDAARAKRALASGGASATVYQTGNVVLLLSSRLAADQVSGYEIALKQTFKLVRKQARRSQAQQGATPTPSPVGQ